MPARSTYELVRTLGFATCSHVTAKDDHSGFVQIRSIQQDLCLLSEKEDVRIGPCYWDHTKYDVHSKQQRWYIEDVGHDYFRLRPRTDLTQCLSFGLSSVFQDVPSLTLGLCTDSMTQQWRYNKGGNLTISHEAVEGYMNGEFCARWYATDPPRENEPILSRCDARDVVSLKWHFIDVGKFCLVECVPGSREQSFTIVPVNQQQFEEDKFVLVVLRDDPTLCAKAHPAEYEDVILADCDKSDPEQVFFFETISDNGGEKAVQWVSGSNSDLCVEPVQSGYKEKLRLYHCSANRDKQKMNFSGGNKGNIHIKKDLCVGFDSCYSSASAGIILETGQCKKSGEFELIKVGDYLQCLDSEL